MEIKFLSVGCGDGIVIRFLGNDDRYHNIIIDGGTEKGQVYENTLKQEIKQIATRTELIDLWIISHIDDDHIGGLLKFINDKELIGQFDLKDTIFWYNDNDFDYRISVSDTSLLSKDQSRRLREYLAENSNAVYNNIFTGKEIDYYGLEIIVLSPKIKKFTKIVNNDDTSILLAGKIIPDWNKKIVDFDLTQFEEDSKKEHCYCIAILIKHNNKKVLLTSDSYPSIIEDSLISLGYNNDNKLDLELMQLSHHGSKFNTSLNLLQKIICNKFVVSADGYNKYALPNKETIARILNHNNHPIEVHITHKNDLTESLFDIDGSGIFDNVSLQFPETFTNALSFEL